jgi:hypothetical protein
LGREIVVANLRKKRRDQGGLNKADIIEFYPRVLHPSQNGFLIEEKIQELQEEI